MTRRLFPAYIWWGDDATWNRLYSVMRENDLVVLNPSTGPNPDDEMERSGVRRRKNEILNRGAVPYGYVDLDYGRRTIDAVLSDMRTYYLVYGIERFFFDQSPPHWRELHFAYLGHFNQGIGQPRAIFNQGVRGSITKPPAGVLVVTYEGFAANAPEVSVLPWEVWLTYDAKGPALHGPWTQGWTADTPPNPWDNF